MSSMAGLWRWRVGRQRGGYRKMLLMAMRWPLPCDMYLLHFPTGAEVPPHVDRVMRGRHFRLNLILRQPTCGGEFVCARPIHASRWVKLFRPDQELHSVTAIRAGDRWVLSMGWVLGACGGEHPAT